VLPEVLEPLTRFTALARVGGGGMGDIFKGIDGETEQPVALKLLRASATAAETARFRREIAVLADLRHPNIVQYVGHGKWHDGRLFLAMEWLDGEDLSQRQRHTPLGMRDAVEVVRRASAAMAAIHARGVVHRDLKLSNIFLVRGRGTAVKLIDFGVVKPEAPDDYQTERGAIIGTPHFMAPEQARGEPIDARADVYSLGAVLFRLVTGRSVFETDHIIALLGRLVLEDPPSPASIRFDVPEALEQVIMRAITRDRAQRYENGAELARALARVGTINNDPPATDRSASAIRKTVPDADPSVPSSGGGGVRATRPGATERRVVAAVVYELGEETLAPDVDASLRDILGDDARLELLAGGQMVAVLGLERSKGDEAMRAARAALFVASAIPAARVAVAVGHAAPSRGNITGEALERAVRQMERAIPGTVRIDGHAAETLEGRFIVHIDEGGGSLLREDESGFVGRSLLGKPTPTVGREKEIALLLGIFAELIEEGTPRAALVTGLAGIGKSRVRSELMQRLEASPSRPDVLLCRGDPMSQSSSMSALGNALRTLMGIKDGGDAKEQVTRVKQHVAQRLPRTLRFLAAFLGELIGVPFPDEADEPLRAARASAQLMSSRLRMALEAYVRACAGRAPQVVVLEDIHWADDTTLDLLDWLLGCPDLRFGVFAFGRPEALTRLPHLWERRNVTRLALAPLSPQAAERLVAAALPKMDGSLRTQIVERAGGNVLFLEELVRSAAEGRDELPLTVQALLQARLDRMAPGVRETLRAGAVFGQSFWTGGVSALLERGAQNDLEELESTEILTRQAESRIAGQDEWMFRQSLVREAAYASILEEDRAELHLAAGQWLEAVGLVDAGLVARHAEAGGAIEHAAELYARATRQAYSNGAQLETALDFARRGLACGAKGGVRAQLLLAQAQVSMLMGRLDDGILAAAEAAKESPTGSDMWGEAHRLGAAGLIESGRAAEGDRLAATSLAASQGGLSLPVHAVLLASRVRGLVDLGRPGEALSVAEDAVKVAEASGAVDAITRTLDAQHFAIMHVGDASRAVTTGEHLIAVAENAGDLVLATRGRLNAGSVLNHLGMFEDARAMLERGLEDARTRRMRILEGFAVHNLGMSYARLGSIDEAIELERKGSLIADECNAARLRVHARVYESVFLVWRGAPGDYGAALNVARYIVEETSRLPTLQYSAQFALARVHMARRELDLAYAAAHRAYGLLAAGPVEEWDEYTRLTFVEALIAKGHEQEANGVLDHALQVLDGRVRTITNPIHRKAFLGRNEEIAALIHLGKTRLGRTFT
jgi:tetratricopeptide (TPR) repeat protein